jgi:predicted acylesterase/phospholipase RssA
MQECDLVMKGGITSGVVYPKALTEIAKTYRLRQIGGTSAGAIAAAFAAAAEFRRQQEIKRGGDPMAGFLEIEERAKELGGAMNAMFQPAPGLEPLHRLLMAAVSDHAKRSGPQSALLRALAGILKWRLVGVGLMIAAGIVAGIVLGNGWLTVSIAFVAAFLFLFAAVKGTIGIVNRGLRDNDFGICTGKTNPGCDRPAFGDWIRQSVDAIAGEIGRPLTIGDLGREGVVVAAITTDLSSGRPYQLPLKTGIFAFRKAEFERLFEPALVEYLCGVSKRFDTLDPAAPDDLYQLPSGDAFPVYLVARMSLSFPGLISAVPLWRKDYGAGAEPFPVRRCLFSDGGISSNFPIHFFDSLLPRRPTFGISLDSWELARDGKDRVSLPKRGKQTTNLRTRNIDSLPGFLLSILDAAKDWQDTLQSMLPGYAERIVTIKLDPAKEGGMNLKMSPELIAQLREYRLGSLATANEIAMVAATMDALKAMNDGSKQMTVWDSKSSDGKKGNFQILPCTREDNGDVAMILTGMKFTAHHSETRFLWFSWSSDKIDIEQAAARFVLNEDVYKEVREAILERLGERATKYVAELPLGD